ncbi:hypothetical protein LWF01_04050 [Saxibacter everestensis]|uniref:Sigma-70 family RNA polymerase sigma factor n=1 Tax=Saxibacter everestensis TaxID=2909229 RepID=A0ABY8QVD5_9MICO|nr:hypothetical protein LWF01_04050 [Brevibacteriaceae bacterium ZFBP1038]
MTDQKTAKETVPMCNEDFTEPTEAEIEVLRQEEVFASTDQSGPDLYPRMFNMSAGFMYSATLHTQDPAAPEYLTLPMPSPSFEDGESLRFELAVAKWNTVWESAQYRRRVFGAEDLPPRLYRIADRGDNNIVFVPRTRSRYYEYAPLFHLLPTSTLQLFGLPQLTAGQWPFSIRTVDIDNYLPADFEKRLARAWAATVWRHMVPGSPLRGFSKDDPLRLLAHNLDYWLPAATEVIQDILRTFPTVDQELISPTARLLDSSVLPGVTVESPRKGGDLWRGEADAKDVLAEVVHRADTTGQLRAILEAVRSNRVVDDFSDFWSFEKEDFERRLYHKRSKVKVTFVELTDTIPVQGPETQVVGSIVHGDFLALLNAKDREVVVLLSSGVTKLTEIAQVLGYANHSAVSKRLTRIRRQAEEFFGQVD